MSMVLMLALSACSSSAPEVPKAAKQFSDTQACVEPLADMRINHMEYILHQRDDTVIRGIRTRQHSLEECINCHVTKSDEGEYPAVTSSKHFCKSCHEYTAVSIDCFQCHNDNPVDMMQLTQMPADHPSTLINNQKVVLNDD